MPMPRLGFSRQVHTGLEKQLQDQVGSLSQCLSEMETLTGSVVLSMENSNQQMMEVEKEVRRQWSGSRAPLSGDCALIHLAGPADPWPLRSTT